MGRPTQIRDEDIDAERPSDHNSFPSCKALRAHIDLATIMGRVVSQTFRVRRRREEDVDDVLRSLELWKENLPPSLQLQDDQIASDNRSRVLLHLLRNQVRHSSFLTDQ